MAAADALYARMADAFLDDGALPGLIESLRHQRFLDGVEIVRFVQNETTKYKVVPIPEMSALAEARTLIDKHFAAGNGCGDSRFARARRGCRQRMGETDGCRAARTLAAFRRCGTAAGRSREVLHDGRDAAPGPRSHAHGFRAR